MSTIQSNQDHAQTRPIKVNYVGPDGYTVDGKKVSEDEVNQLMASHGVVAKGGRYVTLDGVEVGPRLAAVVGSMGGDPDLPDVHGRAASHQEVMQRLHWLRGFEDGALMWHAMAALARGAILDMKNARELRDELTHQANEARKEEIQLMGRQIQAERAAANETLAWSVAGAVVSFGLGAYGAGDTTDAVRSGLGAASTGIGDVVRQSGNAYSKNVGNQREADDARLGARRTQYFAALVEEQSNRAQSDYDEARELLRLAFRIMVEIPERRSQEIQRATS
ncbi:MAG: hypothetical protein R3C68_02240 [Myxococcota bacterium]